MTMLQDEIRNRIHHAVDSTLSHMEVTPSLERAIINRTRGEETVRRKISMGFVFALVLLLTMAAMGVAATRFGILEANRWQKDNAAFGEHILTVDETYENEYMTLTVNDAVFDGVTLMLTMDVQPKPGCGEGVYVYPRMTAEADGKPLEVEIEACRGDLMSGFWVPERDESVKWLEGTYGADYVVTNETEEGRIIYDPQTSDVTWTLTLDIVRPVYAVRRNTFPLTEDTDYNAYLKQFAEAYANEEILLTECGSVVDYIYEVPYPEGMERLDWQRMKLTDKLIASGAFERVDTATVVFTTKGTQVVELGEGQRYQLGDYEATIEHLSVTFGRMDYEIHVRKTRGGKTAGEEHAAGKLDLEFAVLVDGCEAERSYDSSHPLNDNESDPDPVVYYRGGMTLFGEAESVTFVPCFGKESHRQAYAMTHWSEMTPEQAAMAFTIELL